MTTSWPAAATQMRVRANPAMLACLQPKVFLRYMPFMPQHFILPGLDQLRICWLVYPVARQCKCLDTADDNTETKGPFIATQLNSMSSWVASAGRCRHFTNATQLNSTHSTSSWVELSCVAIDTLTGSRRSELIGDSCSRCERVDNSTSNWVELGWVELCLYKRALSCLLGTLQHVTWSCH